MRLDAEVAAYRRVLGLGESVDVFEEPLALAWVGQEPMLDQRFRTRSIDEAEAVVIVGVGGAVVAATRWMAGILSNSEPDQVGEPLIDRIALVEPEGTSAQCRRESVAVEKERRVALRAPRDLSRHRQRLEPAVLLLHFVLRRFATACQ